MSAGGVVSYYPVITAVPVSHNPVGSSWQSSSEWA